MTRVAGDPRIVRSPGSPVELRFIDLFMLIVTALVFVAIVSIVVLSQDERRPVPLAAATRSLPPALAGEPYDLYLAARGGEAPYAWSIAGGSLPRGLAFDGNAGRIHGVAGSAASFPLTLELRDRTDAAVRVTLPLAVRSVAESEPLHIDARRIILPEAVTFTGYRQRLDLLGGAGPFTWTAEGPLPPGLRLTDRGEIAGVLRMKPKDGRLAQPWTFNVVVDDAKGRRARHGIVLPLRYRQPPSALGEATRPLADGMGIVLKEAVLPLVLVTTLIVMLLAVTGFGGGYASGWPGVFRRRKDWP